MELTAIAPIYILVLIGFIAVKSGYLPEGGLGAINLLTLKILVPVVIFLALFRMAGREVLNAPFIFSYALGSLAIYSFAFLGARRFFQTEKANAAIEAVGAAGSNSIFLGFPIAHVVMGDIAELGLSWVLIVENLMLIPLALFLSDHFRAGGSQHIGGIILRNLRNPILLAILLGLLLPHLIDHLWTPLDSALEKIKNATGAVSLLLIGGFLARARYQSGQMGVVFITGLKLIAHPLAVRLLCILFGLSGELTLLAVIFAAVSCFGIYANFCEEIGEGEFGASVFFLTTLLAPITVWLWIYVIG